jgi:hypothetical protein
VTPSICKHGWCKRDPQFNSWYPRDAEDYGMTEYSGARASAILGADAPANATPYGVMSSDRLARYSTGPIAKELASASLLNCMGEGRSRHALRVDDKLGHAGQPAFSNVDAAPSDSSTLSRSSVRVGCFNRPVTTF